MNTRELPEAITKILKVVVSIFLMTRRNNIDSRSKMSKRKRKSALIHFAVLSIARPGLGFAPPRSFVIKTRSKPSDNFQISYFHRHQVNNGISPFVLIGASAPPYNDGNHRMRMLPCGMEEMISTASCWTAASLSGHWVERKLLPDSGILVTMALSALFSSTQLVSTQASDVLSSVCWGTFLPASLALLLLSPTKGHKSDQEASSQVAHIRQSIQQLAIPFILASIGSVLGCVCSFWLCTKLSTPWLLPKPEARIALSCLAASFVGGSVNFFATAKAIEQSTRMSSSTIVGSMAATDIVVMAIYFSLIGSAMSSERIQQWFSNPPSPASRLPSKERNDETTAFLEEQGQSHSETISSPSTPSAQVVRSVRGTVLASAVALGIVHVANVVETRFQSFIPGLACAVIAVVAPMIQKLLRRWGTQSAWWIDLQAMAKPLSQLCFLSLFASIGSTANLNDAAQSGLACLMVSLVALAVHFLTSFTGSIWFSKFHKRSVFFRLGLDQVLVASNAAIGGPATAAAFCGRIPPTNKGSTFISLQGLTYAATFWGIVGYAMGTTTGVVLYRVFGYT